MSMSVFKSIYQRLCLSNIEDERYCLCCHKKMSEIRNFDIFFYNDLIICPDCMKNFKVHKQTYRIKETFMYVLYEYDEFLERLFFQYKEQRDIVLKDVFLNSHKYLSKTFKHYCVCSLCSSDAKRMERGFEPVVNIYATLGVFVHSPFYKKENVNNSTKLTKGISMNLETSAGSGDYKLVTQSTWPLWGYALNNDLSKCENGSTIIWDDENNAVKINGRLTDKCYFYFDKLPLITFKIDSVEYQSEQGMSFLEWSKSEFNTFGYYIPLNDRITKDYDFKFIKQSAEVIKEISSDEYYINYYSEYVSNRIKNGNLYGDIPNYENVKLLWNFKEENIIDVNDNLLLYKDYSFVTLPVLAEPKDQGILQKDEEGNYEYLITVPQLSEQYKNYAILYYNYENSMCEIMDVAEENINFNNTQITFYSSIEGLIFSIIAK